MAQTGVGDTVERGNWRPWARPRLDRGEQINGWLFITPALVLLAIFMIYPIVWSLWMSLQVGKGMNFHFGGLANIDRLTKDPVFLRALVNTCIFFVVQVPVMISLALLFAVALNDPRLRFRGLFRTAIFLPCVTSLIAYSTLFKSMFETDGVVNNTLVALHIVGGPIPWLQDPFWAKVLIILAITWRWTGYNMIFYLAALQNVDRSIYEVARIDGVPAWARFTGITLPMLKPACRRRASCKAPRASSRSAATVRPRFPGSGGTVATSSSPTSRPLATRSTASTAISASRPASCWWH